MTGPCVTCGERIEYMYRRGRKCRKCENARIAAWKARNRERSRQLNAESRERNRETLREKGRAYAAANRDAMRERSRRWQQENPELDRAKTQRYYARKFHPEAERVLALVVLEMDDGVCGICGEDVIPTDFHVDHVWPLAEGGIHAYSNVQVAHPDCNRRKNRHLDYELES